MGVGRVFVWVGATAGGVGDTDAGGGVGIDAAVGATGGAGGTGGIGVAVRLAEEHPANKLSAIETTTANTPNFMQISLSFMIPSADTLHSCSCYCFIYNRGKSLWRLPFGSHT